MIIQEEIDSSQELANYEEAFEFVEHFVNQTFFPSVELEFVNSFRDVSTFFLDKLNSIFYPKQLSLVSRTTLYLTDLCSNTLQAINQVLVIRTKIEANLMVGVVKYVRVQVESAANIYNDIRLAILRTAHTAVDPNIASDLMQKLPESLEALHTETVRVASQISHAIKTVKRKVWEHKAVVQDFMAVVRKSFRELSNFLQQFKAGKEVFQFYYEYQSWFEELHLSQQMQRSFNEIKSFVTQASIHFEELFECLTKAYEGSLRAAHEHYTAAMKFPPFNLMVTMVESAVEGVWNVVKMYNQKNHPQILRVVQKIIGKIDAVTSTAVRFLDIYVYQVRDLMDYELTFNPQQGHIMYKQLLPFTWYSFTDTPDLVKLLELLEQDESGVQSSLQSAAGNASPTEFDLIKFQYDLLDAINTISSALSVQTLVPPFSASAVIAGNTYIKTFDGKFYQFNAGSDAQGCSYLLTADFMYKRFSVIANYKNDKRSSISVVSDNHIIEIDEPDSDDNELIKITLDKRNVELPIAYDHTFATREGSTVIVENTEGLRVVCNMDLQLCSVTISGWYFGKTGGLLGIYDNEPSNDWMTPERDVVDDIKTFATSWQMSDTQDGASQCPVKSGKDAGSEDDLPSDWEREECEKIFRRDTSSLRPCFNTVDTEPYMEMCLRDIRRVRNRPEKMNQGICLTAAAYVEECRGAAGIKLWVPRQCASCTGNHGQYMVAGQRATYEEGRNSNGADVVFLIERKSTCPADFHTHQMAEIPGLIARSDEGADMRFAVVGFGGKDSLSDPHVITSGNRIFSTAEHTTTTLKTSYQQLQQGGAGRSDVFSALKYAVDRMPYRAGASKTVVLVTCDDEGHHDGDFYGDAMTMLQNYDVGLHHMTPMDVTTRRQGKISAKKSAKLAAKVLGFYGDAAVALVPTGDGMDLSRGLRAQLNNPKDYLSTLALNNGGSVIDSKKLDKNAGDRWTAKRASKAAAMLIGRAATRSPSCQECHCWPTASGQGHLKCQKCILTQHDITSKFNRINLLKEISRSAALSRTSEP